MRIYSVFTLPNERYKILLTPVYQQGKTLLAGTGHIILSSGKEGRILLTVPETEGRIFQAVPETEGLPGKSVPVMSSKIKKNVILPIRSRG